MQKCRKRSGKAAVAFPLLCLAGNGITDWKSKNSVSGWGAPAGKQLRSRELFPCAVQDELHVKKALIMPFSGEMGERICGAFAVTENNVCLTLFENGALPWCGAEFHESGLGPA